MIELLLFYFILFTSSHFASRVAQRRHLLDLAVLFYTHLAEVTSWLESLRHHLMEDINLAGRNVSLEEVQVRFYFKSCSYCPCCNTFGDELSVQNILEQLTLRKDSTLEGCLNTLAEGTALVEQLSRRVGITRFFSISLD